MTLKRIFASLILLLRPKRESKSMTILAALAAIATFLTAILKFLPSKSEAQKEAERRAGDFARIHKEGEEFKKNRDTSNLGDID
jgi:hypothetical protein